MPIGNISPSGTSFTNAAEYDLAQGKYRHENKFKKPEILEQNFLSSKHYKEIGREFRELSNENKKCLKPVLKFSISFDPSEELTDKEKFDFTKSVMLEMGLTDQHQFMITRHSDKAHDHHHVLANRVGLDSKVISDSFAINKLETVIDKVEKLSGMSNHLANKRRFVYDESSTKGYKIQVDNFASIKPKSSSRNSKKGLEKKKQYIQDHVELASGISQSFEQFIKLLNDQKIKTSLRRNNEGNVTGISFEFNNYSIKGSSLGTNFKASNIEKKISSNINEIELLPDQLNLDEANRLRLMEQEELRKKDSKNNPIL